MRGDVIPLKRGVESVMSGGTCVRPRFPLLYSLKESKDISLEFTVTVNLHSRKKEVSEAKNKG